MTQEQPRGLPISHRVLVGVVIASCVGLGIWLRQPLTPETSLAGMSYADPATGDLRSPLKKEIAMQLVSTADS